LEVLEKNLRSFLGTTCMEETVMESFRRLSQMNAVARADAPADEEVLPCE
jgi:hypothetical protein